jgi:hypothetical protein
LSDDRSTWPDTVREASELLLELSGADLLPEEYTEVAMRLGSELAEIGQGLN